MTMPDETTQASDQARGQASDTAAGHDRPVPEAQASQVTLRPGQVVTFARGEGADASIVAAVVLDVREADDEHPSRARVAELGAVGVIEAATLTPV